MGGAFGMGGLDLTGLAISVAVGALIATAGIGIDSLLLARHVKAVDDLALRWWMFFDSLRIIDIPRIAVALYIRAKNAVLGEKFDLKFFARSFVVSLVLTALTVPGGRLLGLALLMDCNVRSGFMSEPMPLAEMARIAWSWTGLRALGYLVPVNIAFDLATIFVTIFILSKALRRTDYFLLALILVDVLACVVLFYNAIYIADRFDSASMVSATGYFSIFRTFYETWGLSCTSYHIFTSKLLFVSTILLPTLIYLIMIVGLFFLRESFKLFKFAAMYLLEKSVEDRKTIFAHLGTALGLAVAVGKAALEITKALTPT